jgi:hypothetical protein
MSASKKLATTLANAGGGGLNVEEVFSTYLYTGNSSTQTITNGIDLDGEGGLVWVKNRDTTGWNYLVDTEQGTSKRLSSNWTSGAATDYNSVTSFNSDGFSVGYAPEFNQSDTSIVSWTFRKAPKFFDVVTYTGDGVAGRTVSHNLGSVPGCIIIKATSAAGNWNVYHRGNTAAPETDYLLLNRSSATVDDNTRWNDTAPTATEFTLGTADHVNASGFNYVAYLFAHNDGDGEFGESGDQDIIKCGSYAGNGSTDGPEIDLGFEPQWIMVKKHIGGTGNWYICDAMRGIIVGGADEFLRANTSDAENDVWGDIFAITPTGFKLVTSSGTFNDGADEFIYIAIRRPMKTPESGSEVFAVNTWGSGANPPSFLSNFPVDMMLFKNIANGTQSWRNSARLIQGKQLVTDTTAAETDVSLNQFDYMDGWQDSTGTNTSVYSWMFRRAPGFFDVVCWTGSNIFNHNLGVNPELVILKNRDNSAANWPVWFVANGSTSNELYLDTNLSAYSTSGWASTSTQVTVRSGLVNTSNNHIAYLFATLPGVSKVGSYTGNGSSQTIDCGFSTGARFVLIKRIDVNRDWYVWDTERGIVAGNDPFLKLNTTEAEDATRDALDPHSSGFIVNQTINPAINHNGGTFIFYAIA